MSLAPMIVAFQDFRAPYLELKEEFDVAYHRFMESGWLVLGKETSAFEEEYAAYCQSAFCVGVANGLDALHLALRAMDIGPGDEVIVPSNTYIATWLAVTQVGAVPVPVEPDPATYNIDPARIEKAITARTKVILAVNLYGQPCDYDVIIAIAHRHGLKVAIDNAQAHGARYKGRGAGGIADIECHSFYPSKNLGAYGEAGAITTNDAELADKVRVLRNYGSRVRYHNEVPGYNSRIDELQAAFLRVKLRHLDEWNARRAVIAKQYLAALGREQETGDGRQEERDRRREEGDREHVTGNKDRVSEKKCEGGDTFYSSSIIKNPKSKIVLPTVPPWAKPVWHLFVIRHPCREALQKHLADHGIQTLVHYPIPPHLSGAYSSLPPPDSCSLSPGRWHLPIAEQLANEVLSLPISPHTTHEHVREVCGSIQTFDHR
jgi:dTDP-4-amino-4,6-dideoxygalactose transaminase